MNKQTETLSKATPRPLLFLREISNGTFCIDAWPEDGGWNGLCEIRPLTGDCNSKAKEKKWGEKIVQAVNQYEALCAVAEAAKEFKQWLDSKGNNPTIWPDPPALWKFKQALATLETVRKGAQ